MVRKDPEFEREELHPTYLERDVRSPCDDDRCLIISNKHPFPDVRMFKYRPYIDVSVNEAIHRQFEDPYRYINNPFSFAVDNSDYTAYKSTRPIVTGDYIGIDMLLNVNRKIEFRMLFQMGDSWINNIGVEIAGPDAVYVSSCVVCCQCHSHPCDLIPVSLINAQGVWLRVDRAFVFIPL